MLALFPHNFCNLSDFAPVAVDADGISTQLIIVTNVDNNL